MPQDSRISRKTLSIMIVVITLFIVVLYNLPGSRRAGEVEPGPLVMPEQNNDQTATKTLTSIDLIEKAEKKSHQVRIESWKTPKGAKVMFVHAPEIPMLDVRVVFNAGSAQDSELPGLAKLTSSMLDEGAGVSDVDEIAQHFEGLGASLSTSSYRDMAVVSLRTLSDKTYRENALTLFYDIVARPTFPNNSLKRIKAQMQVSLQQEKQNPSALGGKFLFETLYPNQPYGIHSNGTEESLTLIGRDALQAFHKKHYVANNMVVAMIGNIKRSQAEFIAMQLDKQLPAGQAATALLEPKPLQKNQSKHIEFPSTQTHVTVANIGVKRGDPNWFPLYVGNEILGAGGFSSRLNKVIRQDNGLAYSVGSHFTPMAEKGPFIIGLQTRNDQSQQAISLVNETLSDFINNGPTQEELEDAKRHILGSFPLQTASNSSIVNYLGMIGFYNLPHDYLETFPQQIDAVTKNDIKQAFERVINPKAMLTITVGSAVTDEK